MNINLRLYIKINLCFTLILVLSGCITKIESIKTDTIRVLEEGTGYLFITINSNASFRKFAISGEKHIVLKKPDFYNDVNYYLVPVPAGRYHIKQLGISYGGEFNFDEDDDENLWGFEVKPDIISYVGELRIRQQKYRYASFELINNSSLALEYLEEKYPKILAKRTIEYHGPGADSFFDYILNAPKVKIVKLNEEDVR
ncbi:MAG: hypothetical protein COA86_06855 [Kangiella sp.]|nr:MAG: hypothetical protein COA86_06855 [Kangiella sp.]